MYTSGREILKGGRILDQPLTCSFARMYVAKIEHVQEGSFTPSDSFYYVILFTV